MLEFLFRPPARDYTGVFKPTPKFLRTIGVASRHRIKGKQENTELSNSERKTVLLASFIPD